MWTILLINTENKRWVSPHKQQHLLCFLMERVYFIITDHLCRSAVLAVVVKVTLSIVGFNEASEPPVQSEVRHVIGGEHQEVVGLLPPAYLLLFTAHRLQFSLESLRLVYGKYPDKSYFSTSEVVWKQFGGNEVKFPTEQNKYMINTLSYLINHNELPCAENHSTFDPEWVLSHGFCNDIQAVMSSSSTETCHFNSSGEACWIVSNVMRGRAIIELLREDRYSSPCIQQPAGWHRTRPPARRGSETPSASAPPRWSGPLCRSVGGCGGSRRWGHSWGTACIWAQGTGMDMRSQTHQQNL